MLNVFEPLRSTDVANEGLISGGNDFPYVTKEEKPYDGERDSGQTVFATTTHGAVGATQTWRWRDGAWRFIDCCGHYRPRLSKRERFTELERVPILIKYCNLSLQFHSML